MTTSPSRILSVTWVSDTDQGLEIVPVIFAKS